MTKEEHRIKSINEMSAQILDEWLEKLENEPNFEADKLIATIYGSMIAASLMGHSPESLISDVNRAVEGIKEGLKDMTDGFHESDRGNE